MEASSAKRKLDDSGFDETTPKAPRTEPSVTDEAPRCMICFNDLDVDVAFDGAHPDGTITLACGNVGETPHQFHGPCLRGWVESQSVTGISISVGQATRGQLLQYQRERPSCPLCRTQLEAAAFWPDLAWVDQLPQDGQTYWGPNPHYDPTLDVAPDEESDEDFEPLEVSTQRVWMPLSLTTSSTSRCELRRERSSVSRRRPTMEP